MSEYGILDDKILYDSFLCVAHTLNSSEKSPYAIYLRIHITSLP